MKAAAVRHSPGEWCAACYLCVCCQLQPRHAAVNIAEMTQRQVISEGAVIVTFRSVIVHAQKQAQLRCSYLGDRGVR
jgi:hypothetical protein